MHSGYMSDFARGLMGKCRRWVQSLLLHSQFVCEGNSQQGAWSGAQCTYVEGFGPAAYEWKNRCLQVVSKVITRTIDYSTPLLKY
jgi:hypothetical protein